MTLEELRNFCLSLPGVTEDIKWEEHLCFCVGTKMFIITSPDKFPVDASFKTTPELFEYYAAMDGFTQAPYFAKHQWLHIDNIESLPEEEWKTLLKTAYDLVFSKLTKKVKEEIMGTSAKKAQG